ncbi:hypothetical protein IG193_00010 [Infirmifilum lucidum]|uniref:Uncharacterized protein n=1 Tax=Infirmifilum lucidum TaxID=2776706 RepID=A0A7L9FGK2_9CREN|nr:hypothetical protein [Infirmifilum lucidum]QOJ78889.1 hypothetical protein IG193_00010 [Infirmifilum lucidum]
MKWYSSKFLFPLFILIILFLPPITSGKGIVWGVETGEVIRRVLSTTGGKYTAIAIGAHVLAITLIILLIGYGNRFRCLFNAFVAGDYILIAFLQNIATIKDYGFSILTSNVVIFLIVGMVWAKEALNPQNDFAFRRHPWWRYWVIPFAFLAFWFPAGPQGEIDFNPIYLLTSDFGVAFCLTTPVIVAILTLIYPQVNKKVLNVTCSAGLLYGFFNISAVVVFPELWWLSGVLHTPLFLISLYGLLLPRILKIRTSRVPMGGLKSGKVPGFPNLPLAIIGFISILRDD